MELDQNTTERVKTLALEVGFARVGISSPDLDERAQRLDAWLDAGCHASMAWMPDTRDLRMDPRGLLPGCRAVVALALPYATPEPLSVDVNHDPERVWISRYAWGDDYHDVTYSLLRRLERRIREEFGEDTALRGHSDSGPVLERQLAVQAGLGWFGKNSCVIDGERGSFHFLAVLLTDLPLVPDEPVPERCGSCTRCIDACPTQAITAPGYVDARRCLSYLTIEHRGPVPASLAERYGGNIFGCDVCQDVCPWNQRARATPLSEQLEGETPPEFRPRENLFHPTRESIATLWRGEFRRRFRGSTIRRTGMRRLKANLAPEICADATAGPRDAAVESGSNGGREKSS